MVEKEGLLEWESGLESIDEKEGSNPLISFPPTTPRLVKTDPGALVDPTRRPSRGPSRDDISLHDSAKKNETRNQERGICIRTLCGSVEKLCQFLCF